MTENGVSFSCWTPSPPSQQTNGRGEEEEKTGVEIVLNSELRERRGGGELHSAFLVGMCGLNRQDIQAHTMPTMPGY